MKRAVIFTNIIAHKLKVNKIHVWSIIIKGDITMAKWPEYLTRSVRTLIYLERLESE